MSPPSVHSASQLRGRLIILSYCPDLLLGDSCTIKGGDEASIEVAASSAKSISDIIAFAELVSETLALYALARD